MTAAEELIESLGRSAALSPAQAGAAVQGMLRFLAARLPSPLFGEVQALLAGPVAPDDRGAGGEARR